MRKSSTIVLALIASLLLVSCSDLLIQEMARITAQAGKPSVSPATGATITAHEAFTFTFPKTIDPSTVTVSGTIGTITAGQITWSTVTNTNDTLTINSANAVSWTAGTGRSLRVTVNSSGQTTDFDYSYTVFRGVCVSLKVPDGGDDANPGTASMPKETIASGIAKATTAYLTAPGATAEVRVSKGTFGVNWNTSTNRIVLADGIVLEGGYQPRSWGNRDIAVQASTIEDNSITGGTSITNPNRAISIPTGITSITVVDGFTIRPGTGASNAAVFMTNASPVIRNLTIIGRAPGSGATLTHGIIVDGAPQITSNTIFSTWEGSALPASSTSYGVYCLTQAGKHPTIQGNTISGGKAPKTIAIYSGGEADIIQNNTISAGTSGTGTTIGIQCEGGTATISGNSIDAGSDANATHAHGIELIWSGSTTNPAINGNTFTCSGASTLETYAIFEGSTNATGCDPSAVANNHFATFFSTGPTLGLGYYYDDFATKITNLTTSITLSGTSGTLASFSNTSP